MITTLLMLSALGVPPGASPENNNQPFHGGDPVVRRFEQRADDDFRRRSWDAYCRRLDDAWALYRAAGSSPRALATYKRELAAAKRDYVNRDPRFVAFTE
jgi:hypothetical protein